ncbi:hypothetical protein ABC347_15095 [Sphingomonas sp. 1P06PA]|uniref:hypothetical protein n=1 Tax=Sphingomonas sp. 1P06PA TaxID=554121 RepID=UPI0039A46E63
MHLLSRIEKFLRKTGMKPSRFGRESVGDPRLVKDLRRGREPRPTMTARVHAYLDRAG